MIKIVLFDLDSTLYYLDEENFLPVYFDGVGKKATESGLDYKQAVKALYHGSINMNNSDGVRTNEQLFWDAFYKDIGILSKEKREALDSYYEKEFKELKYLSKPIEQSIKTIKYLKEQGYRLVVATNPVLPMSAQLTRLSWAGLVPDDFLFITSYETFHYSKPDPRFYLEVIDRLSATASECLMVGNDVKGDILAAQEAGLKTFIITRQLSNRDNNDISQIPQGDFVDLLKYIDSLK